MAGSQMAHTFGGVILTTYDTWDDPSSNRPEEALLSQKGEHIEWKVSYPPLSKSLRLQLKKGEYSG